MSKTNEVGPILHVELIGELLVGCGPDGAVIHEMPSRQDLELAAVVSNRTVAGYEMLLTQWRHEKEENEKLRNYIASIEPQLQFFPDLSLRTN